MTATTVTATPSAARIVEVGAADLPLHCPMPGDALWCSHPRVFLEVTRTGEAMCPYCGTLYRLKDGVPAGAHH